MHPRFTPLLLSFASLALLSASAAGQGDAKATKKTVRAADGTSIVYDVRGKGDTAIVFLHGWCGDRVYWKNQADVFAPDYTIVTVDQAGHGESGKDRKEWTVASLAGDVEAIVKDLGLKRVILVGHSMGGQVSLAAAKRMPETVIAVIGVVTLQNADFQMPKEAIAEFMKAFESDFKGTMRAGLGGLLSDKVAPELKDWLITRAEAQDPKMATGLMRDLSAADTKALMKDVKVPIRCINSAGGYAFFNATSVANNKKYADFDAVLIDDVGHYPMLEKPAEFNAKLREVLKSLAVKK